MELREGDEKVACLHCIFCKAKNRTQWRKQVIQSDQDVHVCGIFWMKLALPSTWLYFFLPWDMGYLSFLLFFMLLDTNIFSSTFLSHSPYSFCNMKSHVKMIEYFCVDERHIFCATSSVEVGTSIYRVFVILILKA